MCVCSASVERSSVSTSQCKASGFDNRKFKNESITSVETWIDLPDNMPSGEYDISIRVVEGKLPIKLGIKKDYMDEEGFYKLSAVEVLEYAL